MWRQSRARRGRSELSYPGVGRSYEPYAGTSRSSLEPARARWREEPETSPPARAAEPSEPWPEEEEGPAGARLEYSFIQNPGLAQALRDRAVIAVYAGLRLDPSGGRPSPVRGLRAATHAGGQMVALVDCVAPPDGGAPLHYYLASCDFAPVLEKARKGAGRGRMGLERLASSLRDAVEEARRQGLHRIDPGDLVFYGEGRVLGAERGLELARDERLSLTDKIIAVIIGGSALLEAPSRQGLELVIALRDLAVYEVLLSDGNPATQGARKGLSTYLEVYAVEQARIVPGEWAHVVVDGLGDAYQRPRRLHVRPEGPPERSGYTLIQRGSLEEYLERQRIIRGLWARLELRRTGPAPL